MRGGLTIDVYIPKGILHQPSAIARFFWFVGGNPILLLPLVTVAVMFLLWWYKGRDPDPGMSVAPMYEPPEGMSPAEAGALLEDEIHPRDITSTMVDLAVRGYIKIEETAEKGLIFTGKDYVFHLLKPRAEWNDAGLAPHERVMLENVFEGGQQTRLSELKNRFYTAVPIIRQDIMAALKNKGMYLLDPESANGYSVGAGVVIVSLFVAFQFLGWANFLDSIPLLIGAGIVSAVIWWLFARVMTAKTVKGARAWIAVLGFQEFMNRVDGERLKKMPPTTFEKYLPYAMALGVEHHWAQAFAGIVKIRRAGTWGRATGRGWGLIRFSFRARCTAWRAICTRYSSPRRGRVLRDQVGAAAENSAEGAEDFRAAGSAAAAGARSSSPPRAVAREIFAPAEERLRSG